MRLFRSFLSLVIASTALSWAAAPSPVAGRWDATVVVNGLTIPFRFEIAKDGAQVQGSFFNGDEKVTSTRSQVTGDELVLYFDHYASRLEARYAEGQLTGKYDRGTRGVYPFAAHRFAPSPVAAADVPAIAGLWEVAVKSTKGEAAWKFIVRQSGPEISAAILRVDGDTGSLAGTYRDGKFLLSHFSGARPLLLEVTPQADGTLTVVQNGKESLVATRSTEARAKGLPEPTDPSKHTSVKDPTEPFRFRFKDVDGNVVANTDARFQNKVVLVAIGGSWCPNCHDEAPFLADLYRRYRDQGLEIVALDFEEPEQLQDLTRLRAFIKQYGIPYPVLVAGEPGELQEKVPQAVNLNAWPTTFFLGRDGRVRSVHAGFAGKASGALHTALKEDVTALIERLLAENAVTSR